MMINNQNIKTTKKWKHLNLSSKKKTPKPNTFNTQLQKKCSSIKMQKQPATKDNLTKQAKNMAKEPALLMADTFTKANGKMAIELGQEKSCSQTKLGLKTFSQKTNIMDLANFICLMVLLLMLIGVMVRSMAKEYTSNQTVDKYNVYFITTVKQNYLTIELKTVVIDVPYHSIYLSCLLCFLLVLQHLIVVLVLLWQLASYFLFEYL